MNTSPSIPPIKNNSNGIVYLEKGKVPPQAVDIEKLVLGTALQYATAIGEIVELFRDEKIFYKPAHQEIYETMLEMFRDSEPIDLLSVAQKLKNRKKLEAIGGEFYLIELTKKTSHSHLEHHCRVLMQMFVKRKSIQVADSIISEAYKEDTDIFDLLSTCQKDIDDTAEWLIKKKPSDFKTVVDSFFNKAKNDIPGVINSLSKLQYKMNGYRPNDLIIVAARPGMGKTALILNEALHQAKHGIPVGIFSLEMSAQDLVGRMIANECEIDYSSIHKNKLTDFDKRLMQKKRHEFEQLPIYIHDQGRITPMEVKIQTSKWKRENGVQIVYVDYLQLMNASGKNHSGNREQEISSISRSLKATAMDQELPIVALSQLSRAAETRGGMKRPMLSDLRESGAIEQDADVVMFLLRPEYYKVDTWDDDERTPTKGQCEINFAKFRGGEPGACVVGCELKYMRFHDIEEDKFVYSEVPGIEPEDAFEPIQDSLPDPDDDMPF